GGAPAGQGGAPAVARDLRRVADEQLRADLVEQLVDRVGGEAHLAHRRGDRRLARLRERRERRGLAGRTRASEVEVLELELADRDDDIRRAAHTLRDGLD